MTHRRPTTTTHPHRNLTSRPTIAATTSSPHLIKFINHLQRTAIKCRLTKQLHTNNPINKTSAHV